MPDIVYPYLVEGTIFDAASLNSRFGVLGANLPLPLGINALMPYAVQRGCFQEEHLPETGIIAGEEFGGGFTISFNPSADVLQDMVYLIWGGEADRSAVTDGAGNDLEILFDNPINFAAGMGDGTQKVGGVLIFANLHFMRASMNMAILLDGQGVGPVGFMICIQYLDGNTGLWTTIKSSERFSNSRIIKMSTAGQAGTTFPEDTPLGDGPFDTADSDIYTFQDIALRLWLEEDNFPRNNVEGFRVACNVVNLGNAANPGGYNPLPPVPAPGLGYYRESNLSVIPFHVKLEL